MVEKTAAAEQRRNWAELPIDALSAIFLNLTTNELLHSADGVCRRWHQVALEPQLYRTIGISCATRNPFLDDAPQREKLARKAIDRSAGQTEQFFDERFGSDQLLAYIADRTSGLRRLTLITTYRITGKALGEFFVRCPLLEECDIIGCNTNILACGGIGSSCPKMKRLVLVRNGRFLRGSDEEALEIADCMPQLHHLNLVGNQMTNEGLHAILDKCLHLESLSIKSCFNVDLEVDSGLQAKLSKIKTVTPPGTRNR